MPEHPKADNGARTPDKGAISPNNDAITLDNDAIIPDNDARKPEILLDNTCDGILLRSKKIMKNRTI